MLTKLSEAIPRATFTARLEALDDQRLPPLFTTALHGALGHALIDTSCRAVPRCAAGACSEPASCAAARLTRASPSSLDATGAQPLVLRPRAPVLTRDPILLGRGSSVDCQIVLLGADALAERAVLARALERAIERGLGVDHERRRARLALRALEVAERPGPALEPAPVDEPTGLTPRSSQVTQVSQATLRLLTPLRVQVEHHVRGDFDALALRRALLRRARIVVDAFGDRSSGASARTVEALMDALDVELRASSAPFSIEARDTRVVHIRRYSGRQGARMEWPGVVGTLELAGDLTADQPLFELAAELHLGKNTSFGFGRVELTG
jgi:hypothetical protein